MKVILQKGENLEIEFRIDNSTQKGIMTIWRTETDGSLCYRTDYFNDIKVKE